MFKPMTFSDGDVIVKAEFDKHFKNSDYEVHFNTKTGFEILMGKDNIDPFRTELPLLIDVGIMGSCLNSCSFCYQGNKKEAHMTLDNFKLLIDQVRHHTNQVALGGRGDPNLHPQFKEIVEYARKNNVVPNYTTSGINMTDEQIKISKLCGAVAVSDYGNKYTYNALKRLMDAEIKTNIHIIFSRQNYDKAMKILYGYNPWLKITAKKSKGVFKKSLVDIKRLNAVVFLLFKPQGSGKNMLGMIPTKMQIKSFAEKVFNPRSIFNVGMDSCLINHILKYSNPNKIQRMAVDTCESSRMSVYVSPSMELIPCSFADHPYWGVKITKKKDVHYIWNRSTKFKQFRSILKKHPNQCPLGL